MPRRFTQPSEIYADLLIPQIIGSNLLPNPGFESGITGWSGSNATVTAASSPVRTGTGSLKVNVTAATGSTSFTLFSQNSGQRIYFDIWVLGDISSTGKFVRAQITCNGDSTTQDTVRYKLSSTIWTRMRCSIFINTTGTVTITVKGTNLANGDNFYLDDGYVDFVTNPTTTTSNRRFYYNGVETYLRCCNYNNVPTSNPGGTNFATEEAMLPFDFADIQAQGCNTIRIYNDSYNANDYGRGLDCAWNYGLGVMVLYFIWITSTNYTQSTGGTNRTNSANDFANNLVGKNKNHPAVIAYGYGSEGNYHVSLPNQQSDWFTLVDLACSTGKTIDSTRVFYTSNGGVPVPSIDNLFPNLDILGFTQYGGNSNQVFRGSNLNGFDKLISANTQKAVMLTEIGTGCYDGSTNGNQEYQGHADVHLLSQAESFYPFMMGHTYFQFEDNRNTTNPTDNSWYGKSESVSTGNTSARPKRLSYYIIQNFFLTHPVPGY